MRVSAWVPHWDHERALGSVLSNADLIDEVMLFWEHYDIDHSVVDIIRSAGVRVVNTLFNVWPSSVDLAAADAYDGIELDCENLHAADRPSFSGAVATLADALHARGKTLSVAVYAKTSEPGTWDGPQAQDYAAIGAAADRVRVMGYDFHWQTSSAGPVGPLPWLDAVVTFAARAIPPSKVDLGINLYGYDWVGASGETVMWDEAVARLEAHGAVRNWADEEAEPWFTYAAEDGAHTVWYGDAQSVAARLDLVQTRRIGGAAFWRLGGEDSAVWDEVRGRRLDGRDVSQM